MTGHVSGTFGGMVMTMSFFCLRGDTRAFQIVREIEKLPNRDENNLFERAISLAETFADIRDTGQMSLLETMDEPLHEIANEVELAIAKLEIAEVRLSSETFKEIIKREYELKTQNDTKNRVQCPLDFVVERI